jgi:hypothetical protein
MNVALSELSPFKFVKQEGKIVLDLLGHFISCCHGNDELQNLLILRVIVYFYPTELGK